MITLLQKFVDSGTYDNYLSVKDTKWEKRERKRLELFDAARSPSIKDPRL